MSELSNFISLLNENNLWSSPLNIKRSALLSQSGIAQNDLFLLKKGAFRAFKFSDEEDITIRLIYEGNIFGFLDSFIRDGVSEMELQALRESEILVAKKKDILNLFENNEEAKEVWVKLLEGLLLEFMERETDLLISSPVERFHKVLHRSPRVFQEIPHKYIASYLRMTPETLSRILKS